MSAMFDGLRRKWEVSTAKERRLLVMGVAGLVLMVAILAMVIATPEKKGRRVRTDLETKVMGPVKRDMSAEELAADQEQLKRRVETMEQILRQATTQQASTLGEFKKDVRDLLTGEMIDKRVEEALRKQGGGPEENSGADGSLPMGKRIKGGLAAPESDGAGGTIVKPGGRVGLSDPLPGVPNTLGTASSTPGAYNPGPALPAISAPGKSEESDEGWGDGELRVVGSSSDKEDPTAVKAGKDTTPQLQAATGTRPNNPGAKSTRAAKDDDGPIENRYVREGASPPGKDIVFIPAGSMIKGVLLTGMMAPTGSRGVKNPTPSVVRVKGEAILPSYYRANVAECFVLMSGYGSLATERALMRSEAISCVRSDGGVIETGLSGYAVGSDGMAGIRGTLWGKQGQFIANALAAGVLQSAAQIGSAQIGANGSLGFNTSNGNSGTVNWDQMGNQLAGSAYSGVASVFREIGQYYLELAHEAVPVVEIQAGREVTIILVKGAGLRLRSTGKQS